MSLHPFPAIVDFTFYYVLLDLYFISKYLNIQCQNVNIWHKHLTMFHNLFSVSLILREHGIYLWYLWFMMGLSVDYFC